MPRTHPINSRSDIILASMIAMTTTKAGDDMADIAVTGPAGPPEVKA